MTKLKNESCQCAENCCTRLVKRGVLAKIEDDPIFAMARPSAQRVFNDTMRNRILQVEREWKEIWRSLHED